MSGYVVGIHEPGKKIEERGNAFWERVRRGVDWGTLLVTNGYWIDF